MYYDVEGTSMAFAKRRAQQRGLTNLLFARTKDELAAAARERGFDSVFSFDVLEHLPDLAAELNFLASLLAPGGCMVFDVPAGSTKAHPMHLNHNLDVKVHLAGKGMEEERTLWQKLSPFKQEKFVFRRPA
jgi:2-polyprenyl-3-methyl-5-hydroxy-6-metoxy-1,4-benzoquinol methylase